MMLNCPRFERPREKAIYNGIETLSNQELIAVILRTGNKEMSVLNLASLLLAEIGGFQALKDVDYYQLTKIKGIKQAKVGNRIGDIGYAVEKYATEHNLGIVKELVGHGVGTNVHESPDVPNYGTKGTGPKIRDGMVIAIEPMLTLGSPNIYIEDNDWTVKTEDSSL